MFLRQGDEAGAVRGEEFLHEAKLDVLEVAFGEQAPGDTVDEFVHHDEYQDQHGKEEGPLRDRGGLPWSSSMRRAACRWPRLGWRSAVRPGSL